MNRLRGLLCQMLLLIFCAVFVSGCGGGSSSGTTAPVSKNCIASGVASAKVPVLFTSDAGLGALINFNVGITSITLTDGCGNSVTAYTAPAEATAQGISTIELTHVNGVSEPLAVATLPEATYTTASVSYQLVDMAYLYPDSLTFVDSTYEADPVSGKVELSAPIVVDGKGTAITLDTLLADPVVLGPAPVGLLPIVTVTPVFGISGFRPAAEPANDREGSANVHGLITSVGAGQFTMSNSAGLPLTVSTSAATVLQGIGAISALPLNVPADVDVAIQADGSLLATRVQVEYAEALGAWIGPLVATYPTGAYQKVLPSLWQDSTAPAHTTNDSPFEFQFTGDTVYQINGAAYDLVDLPFTPAFAGFPDAALGQRISVSWTTQQVTTSQPQTDAHAATLMPRSFSGSIASVATEGKYTVYTFALANNDFMATLNHVTSIVAYSNAGTRMEDGALSVGMAVNMHGLLFNDNGVLRLICDQTRLERNP